MEKVLSTGVSIKFSFVKHKVLNQIICETDEDNLIENSVLSVRDDETCGIYVLHNAICSLYGNNVYIVRYVRDKSEIITKSETVSLIPVFCLEVMYVSYSNDPTIMSHVHKKLECFNTNRNYYKCSLHRLIQLIEECMKFS